MTLHDSNTVNKIFSPNIQIKTGACYGALIGYITSVIYGFTDWWNFYNSEWWVIFFLWLFLFQGIRLGVYIDGKAGNNEARFKVFIPFSFLLILLFTSQHLLFISLLFVPFHYKWYLFIILGSFLGGILAFIINLIFNNESFNKQVFNDAILNLIMVLSFILTITITTFVLSLTEILTLTNFFKSPASFADIYATVWTNFLLAASIVFFVGFRPSDNNFVRRFFLGVVGGMSYILLSNLHAGHDSINLAYIGMFIEYELVGSMLLIPGSQEAMLEARIVGGAFVGGAVALGILVLEYQKPSIGWLRNKLKSYSARAGVIAIALIITLLNGLKLEIVGIELIKSASSLFAGFGAGIFAGRFFMKRASKQHLIKQSNPTMLA